MADFEQDSSVSDNISYRFNPTVRQRIWGHNTLFQTLISHSHTKKASCWTCVHCIPSRVCRSASKAIILILLWTFLVAAIFAGSATTSTFLWIWDKNSEYGFFLSVLAVFIFNALASMLFPIAGFLADVYFGRYTKSTNS